MLIRHYHKLLKKLRSDYHEDQAKLVTNFNQHLKSRRFKISCVKGEIMGTILNVYVAGLDKVVKVEFREDGSSGNFYFHFDVFVNNIIEEL